jgi:hypothetical protein
MMAPHEKVGESHFRDLGSVLPKELIKYRFVLDPEGFEIVYAHDRILRPIGMPAFGHVRIKKGVMECWSIGNQENPSQ